MAPTLIGPPHHPTPPPPQQPPSTTATTTADPLMDAMIQNFNTQVLSPSASPQMGLTENLSATFLTSGNPCLDLFFQVVPGTPSQSLTTLLQNSWAHNPLTTLKLICNLRGVRGTGKSDKNAFYTAAFWLHKHHPKTLACNLPSFADFGYFKDLPEILFRVMGLTRAKKMVKDPKQGRHPFRCGFKRPFSEKKKKKKVKSAGEKEARILASAAKQEAEKQAAEAARHHKKADMATTAVRRYNEDPDYRFLHDRVADLFADKLKSDVAEYKNSNFNKLSLAAKWCPSLGSSFDRGTLLCEAIARRVYPREEFGEYEGVEEQHYAYRVRDRLRKEVLVPLRAALELPEVFMSANRWSELPYNRVASVAMKTYKKLFAKHDEERFKEFLDQVKAGKAKVAAGALLPHEIVASLRDADDGEVAELQWKRMVKDLSKVGKMNNCIAVCDVSGSMYGTPMEVCVALGLLLSEVSEEPWKGKVITFSEHPEMHLVEGDDLKSKVEFVERMVWGMNTDFQKVFDLILRVAVQGRLAKENMIKRVFVFSDMEFDQASANPWETDYMVIKRKFERNGYGDAVPEIVFWNLRDSSSIPVVKDQNGVALVSGFSKNMMKLFLEGKDDELNPEAVMEAAISGEEYSKLVVLD